MASRSHPVPSRPAERREWPKAEVHPLRGASLVAAAAPSESTSATGGLKERVAAFERSLIEVALAASDGCQKRAAAALGVLPSTLHAKVRRYGLQGACQSRRKS